MIVSLWCCGPLSLSPWLFDPNFGILLCHVGEAEYFPLPHFVYPGPAAVKRTLARDTNLGNFVINKIRLTIAVANLLLPGWESGGETVLEVKLNVSILVSIKYCRTKKGRKIWRVVSHICLSGYSMYSWTVLRLSIEACGQFASWFLIVRFQLRIYSCISFPERKKAMDSYSTSTSAFPVRIFISLEYGWDRISRSRNALT